jgi:ubiquinone/menaquinone biosynthesis C-methylase UbiE
MIPEKETQIAITTGKLYASIWDQFNAAQWTEFSDNHFHLWSPLPEKEIDSIRGKTVLDAGCGSGRAARSMLLAGAAKVCAIDMGEGCVRNTRERNANFGERLEVRLASALEIPYPDGFFDLVHCDGVLHHTTGPRRGFSELCRVLKPGGKIIMAVYGKGGLMNWAIYASRLFRHVIPQSFTFHLVRAFTSSPSALYAVMDCMYVPIRENYYASEIEKWFTDAGLADIVRMDSTWGPYAYGRWMKGEGYIKFKARKPA